MLGGVSDRVRFLRDRRRASAGSSQLLDCLQLAGAARHRQLETDSSRRPSCSGSLDRGAAVICPCACCNDAVRSQRRRRVAQRCCGRDVGKRSSCGWGKHRSNPGALCEALLLPRTAGGTFRTGVLSGSEREPAASPFRSVGKGAECGPSHVIFLEERASVLRLYYR